MSSLSLKRLESLALREIALLFRNDVKNNKLNDIIVTEVRITNDLSFMTVFYSSYSSTSREKLEKELDETKGYIRSELAKKLKIRKMPELIFKFDEALEYGNHINEILSKLNKE